MVLDVAPGSAVRVHLLSCPAGTLEGCRTGALLHEGRGPARVPLAPREGELWLRVSVTTPDDAVTGEHGVRAEGERVRLVYEELPGERPGLDLRVEGGTVLRANVIRPLRLTPS